MCKVVYKSYILYAQKTSESWRINSSNEGVYEDVNEIEYLKQRNIGPAQSAHVSNTVVPQAGDLNLRDRQLTHSKKLEIRPDVHGVVYAYGANWSW